MNKLKLIPIIFSYGRFFLHIFIFEIFYFFKNYKEGSIKIINNEKYNDNIPCPYFFLHKIQNFIKKYNIKSLCDLGCGGGRSIFFFNKKNKISFYGIENENSIFLECSNLFKKYDNVKIINDDFMNFNFLAYDIDCFFINDPLKKKEDFNKLIKNIIDKNKIIFFILINVDESKRKIFDNYKLIEFLKSNYKSYYIYSSEKLNENSKN